jgi:TPR repeat protein
MARVLVSLTVLFAVSLALHVIVSLMRLLKVSADKGSISGMINLGVHLAQGKFVKQALPEAAKYMKAAADHGEPNAQYNFGLMAIYGIGTLKNPDLGYRYLRQALTSGVTEAQEYFRKDGKPKPI